MKEETSNNNEQWNQTEVWETIPEFNDYEASTMGRIRIKTTGGIVTPFINSKTGYSNVSLKETNGKYTARFVHRLVLQTFKPVDNMDELQCDHINNDR